MHVKAVHIHITNLHIWQFTIGQSPMSMFRSGQIYILLTAHSLLSRALLLIEKLPRINAICSSRSPE